MPDVPRLATIRVPARDEPARSLVVVLHGVGADGKDLEPLARALSAAVPSAEFVLPDGLDPYDGGGDGRQWFSLRGLTDANRVERVTLAAARVSAWIDAELAARSLPPDRLALVGFSQGSMLALHLAVHRDPAPAAVVAYSGRHSDDGSRAAGPRPPVLLVHGERDPVIPVSNAHAAVRTLATRGIDAKLLTVPGLGHGLDASGVEAGADLLRKALDRPIVP